MKKVFLLLFLMLNVLVSFSIQNEISFDFYSQENGLPNNQIQCIFQDSRGWMWFGTNQGLSRFDGYRFKNFTNSPDDSSSLKGNIVRVIFEDRKGNLLIGTENGGLNIFDRNKEKFRHPYKNDNEFKFREVSVNTIAEDNSGNLWLGTDNNILIIDSVGTIRSIAPEYKVNCPEIAGNFIRNLQFDKKSNLWIGTNDGAFLYHPMNNQMERIELPYGTSVNKEIWEVFLDDDGSIWIGTYSNGIFIIDPQTMMVRKQILSPYYERSETVRSISKGIFGDYWIGTRGGLYVFSKGKGTTDFFRHDEREPGSLINNSVLDIFHDSNGETWIGTRGGLNFLAKSKQIFHNYSALPNDNHFLNSSIVYAVWVDDTGKIWLGTEDGGVNILNPATGLFKYLVADENNTNSISQNCVKAFLDDKKGNLWIATFLGGIDVLNLQTQRISHYQHKNDNPLGLSDNRVWDLCLDKKGQVWIATSSGVDKFDPVKRIFTHMTQLFGKEQVVWIDSDSEGKLWIGGNDEIIIFDEDSQQITRFDEHSRSFFEDSKKRYWIATFDNGIAIYSKTNGALKYYNENNGLANNQALCILEDNDRNLWISTSNGLSKFDPEREYFRNFTSKDGLKNNQLCYGAAYKSKSGDLIFGSISGFNIFNPKEIIPDVSNVPIVLTDFKIFNKSIVPGQGKRAVLKKSISETSELTLNYSQNVFTVEFAALNYVNSSGTLYSYYLEGFDKEWNEPSTSRTATYTNLYPNDYILKIKRVVPGIQGDNSNILRLKITVLAPFKMTIWFKVLGFISIIILIYFLIRFILNREKLKNDLVLEKANTRKIHELDMLKLRFFTNISHEIRTPLTLIIGPLEKIISKKIPADEIPGHLNLIHRNAKQLDKLISQLLDFRKLETGNLKLTLTQSDIVEFVADVVHSFDDLAREKGISLRFNTLKKSLVALFDPDKIEKILNNLLSNAFKFTGSGGTITVNLSLVFEARDNDFDHEHPEKQLIELTVKDTGQGINPANIERIFERFFQSGKEKDNSGTGIGLALVKELVKLHKGNIYVSSKPGKGSKFTIHIPFESNLIEHVDEEKPGLVGIQKNSDIEAANLFESVNVGLSKIMLVVEDNPDVRFFIKSHFNTTYQVVEAKNGQEGWDKALQTIPDIIITDIMMPDVDGYDLCRRIKKDERTSHIPVILLTALHSKEHEIKGITFGADDYITKPFDISVLEAKVENMLSIRESLKNKFAGTIILEPQNVIISSPDERFLHRAIEAVEKNIGDSDLDIEKFAVEVGVSRMQLYRKLHALTDMTVKEFIRNIRLKRAAQLLVQKKMNISEIAFAVGFKDLSHFRKCFRNEFGMSASEYIAQDKENNE